MIRKAIPSDIPRIAEILIFTKRCSYRHIFHNDLVSFNEMQVVSLATEYVQNPSLLEMMYVYDDGIIKGLIHIEQRTIDTIEIVELYVDPFFQKEKIGSKLVKEIVSMIKDKTITYYLWVLEKNTSACSFYEKIGFQLQVDRILEEGTEEYLVKYSYS